MIFGKLKRVIETKTKRGCVMFKEDFEEDDNPEDDDMDWGDENSED